MSDFLALAAALDNHANAVRELASAIANSDAPAAPAASAETNKPVRQSRARQQAEKQAEKQAEVEDTSTDAEDTSGDTKDGSTELDYDADIKPLVQRVGKEHGRDALLELFSPFKDKDGKTVDHGTKLQAKNYAAFRDAAELVLGAEDFG